MNGTDNTKAQDYIPFQAVLGLVDTAIFARTGKHLSNIEVIVLQGSWQGQSYPQIAAQRGYTLEYLKNDIGPQLWKRLSQALGEKVTKANLRSIVEQRIYQQQRDSNVQNATRNSSNSILETYEHRTQLSDHGSLKSTPITQANLPSTVQPLHNLPHRDYMRMVGREDEAKKLLEWLALEHPISRISVEGIGGVGKTALLLETAYRCLQASKIPFTQQSSQEILPTFEAIVFTSAKPQHFTPCGILPRFRRERTLRDIFISLARTLNCCNTACVNLEEAFEQIYQALESRRTLLIVDNIETFEQQHDVLGFLYDLPTTVKVVITSRELTPFTAIRLAALSQTEALNLIQCQAQEKGVHLSLGESQKLYQTTGGIPAAIVYAVSQLAAGYGLQNVSTCLMQSKGDFSRFYFESTFQRLQGQPAHRLLMALAFFPKPPLREAICAVAAVSEPIAIEGLAQLHQLSLIQYQQGRYTVQSLTRSYVLAELSAYPGFEEQARCRWINWYLHWVQKHKGKGGKVWNDDHPIEQEWDNIREVMEWCIIRDRYTDACQLWQGVKCYTYSQGYQPNHLAFWEMPLD
jgi:LuxR family glucitol operon transcriptional activator